MKTFNYNIWCQTDPKTHSHSHHMCVYNVRTCVGVHTRVSSHVSKKNKYWSHGSYSMLNLITPLTLRSHAYKKKGSLTA